MAKHIHVHVGKTKDAEFTEAEFKSAVADINRLLTEASRKAEALSAKVKAAGMGQLANQARLLEEEIDTARRYAFKIR